MGSQQSEASRHIGLEVLLHKVHLSPRRLGSAAQCCVVLCRDRYNANGPHAPCAAWRYAG